VPRSCRSLAVPQPAEARAKEATLRALDGETLIEASGKLALLDRLLHRAKAAGSRVLIFSQVGRTSHMRVLTRMAA
jgi:SNF2 family DNA or RNA helicase